LFLGSSLVHTLPITKKNKHTVVTEAPKKYMCCFRASKLSISLVYLILPKNKETPLYSAVAEKVNPEPGFQSHPGDAVDAD